MLWHDTYMSTYIIPCYLYVSVFTAAIRGPANVAVLSENGC
jgi:hypothetical protein